MAWTERLKRIRLQAGTTIQTETDTIARRENDNRRFRNDEISRDGSPG